eukprot:1136433-Pelagomonas_calceolata.AAC.1
MQGGQHNKQQSLSSKWEEEVQGDGGKQKKAKEAKIKGGMKRGKQAGCMPYWGRGNLDHKLTPNGSLAAAFCHRYCLVKSS